MTTLGVLGGGVKAVAVAAKAHVLAEMGVDAPKVIAVERTGVGAKDNVFSMGFMFSFTPPSILALDFASTESP